MVLWTEQTFPVPASSEATLPPCRITYTPLVDAPRVTEVTRDGTRWYSHDGLLYPSISTLLSATDTEGKKSLREWRTRIGHAAAEQITRKAAKNGTRWHTFCECYVTQQPLAWTLFDAPEDGRYAAHLATVLNQQFRTVLASETRVVSTHYGIAGRMDLAVELTDGRRAIVDFKTGKRRKTGNRLANYALQATFYADALSEQWDRGAIDTLIVMQLLPDGIVWQETAPTHWRDQLRERIAAYAQQTNEELV